VLRCVTLPPAAAAAAAVASAALVSRAHAALTLPY